MFLVLYLRMMFVCDVSDYFTPAMLGLKMDQEVLGELVRAKIPKVWQTMLEHNVTWTLVVSRWFICLYIDVLPVEVSVPACFMLHPDGKSDQCDCCLYSLHCIWS